MNPFRRYCYLTRSFVCRARRKNRGYSADWPMRYEAEMERLWYDMTADEQFVANDYWYKLWGDMPSDRVRPIPC